MQHVINVSKWNGTRKKDTRTFGNYKLSMHPSPGKTLKPKVNVLVPEDDPSVMEMDLSPPLTPILEALFWKRLITSLFQPGACHRQLMTVTSFVVAWNRHLLAALSRSSFHPKSAAVSGFSSAVSSRQLIFHSSRITRSSRRHLRPQDLIIFWWPPKSYMSSDVIGSRSYAARIQVNKEKNSRQVSCCVYRDDGSENNRYTPPTSDTDTKRDTLFGRD